MYGVIDFVSWLLSLNLLLAAMRPWYYKYGSVIALTIVYHDISELPFILIVSSIRLILFRLSSAMQMWIYLPLDVDS